MGRRGAGRREEKKKRDIISLKEGKGSLIEEREGYPDLLFIFPLFLPSTSPSTLPSLSSLSPLSPPPPSPHSVHCVG